MKVQGSRKRGRPKRRYLATVRDSIRGRDSRARKYTTELHGGVYRQTLTPRGTNMKISIPVSTRWPVRRNIRPPSDIAGHRSHR